MDSSIPKNKVWTLSPNSSHSQALHADNIMPRDTEQSHRLHEPTSISSHTDPITGNDVIGTTGHPFVVDGILTAYFESEETRTAYLNTPFNHPVTKLAGEPSAEDDRGG